MGIVLSVNLCSGWNAGGPWVTPEHAAKKIVGAATTVKGPGQVTHDPAAARAGAGVLSRYRRARVPGAARVASPQPKLTASSSYRDYLPGLAQDGRDDTRWISNGDKPGMGPTPRNPSISSSITTRPGRPPGCT